MRLALDVADGPGRIPVPLPLAADAPAGVYTLSAKALRGGMLPIEQRRVLEPLLKGDEAEAE